MPINPPRPYNDVPVSAGTTSIGASPAAAAAIAPVSGYVERVMATAGGTTTGTITVAVAINGGSDIANSLVTIAAGSGARAGTVVELALVGAGSTSGVSGVYINEGDCITFTPSGGGGGARLRGRVASLLEVGTGFHPELTGRENIYLNGAILGMSRKEIKLKFDEIVAFAETERFLDTPVKRYSSGMYVRLAFSVAAHLEPEIFVIDEVLAVGDMDFQKKCLGKMSEVAKGGRTVLFVSHNLGSVTALCDQGLLLEQGRVTCSGDIRSVIDRYCAGSGGSYEALFAAIDGKPSITRIMLNEAELRRGNFCCSMDFSSPFPLHPPIGGVVIADAIGTPIWGSNGRFHKNDSPSPSSIGTLVCRSDGIPLGPSTYIMSAWLGDWHQDYDQKSNVLSFSFKPDNVTSVRPAPSLIGHMDWPASWEFVHSMTTSSLS
jgi:lipopolysaccharide transport system ATP-binding protein